MPELNLGVSDNIISQLSCHSYDNIKNPSQTIYKNKKTPKWHLEGAVCIQNFNKILASFTIDSKGKSKHHSIHQVASRTGNIIVRLPTLYFFLWETLGKVN